MTMEGRVREAWSWKLVSETVRRAPDQLRIYEMHPGGGQCDCLALIANDGTALAQLNRSGSFHSFGMLRCSSVDTSESNQWDIWRDALVAADPVEIVNEICRRIGLPIPAKLPSSTPAVLVYRFIAEFLSRTPFDRSSWECRSGFLDSSGFSGCQTRTEWFSRFPSSQQSLQVRKHDDPFGNPACRYWFILKESEPMLCLDTMGEAMNLAGETIGLMKLHQDNRRIWPMIAAVAADLIP